MQKQDETIDQYGKELRTKAKNCEFETSRDGIICGVPDDNLRERLRRVQDLNLEGGIRMCRATKVKKKRMTEIKLEEKEIHAVKRKYAFEDERDRNTLKTRHRKSGQYHYRTTIQ